MLSPSPALMAEALAVDVEVAVAAATPLLVTAALMDSANASAVASTAPLLTMVS
jgi:hypothetical protein